jgi:hypothetical protein
MLKIIAIQQVNISRVLVNGVPGRKIVHVHGLRQGHPLSPKLFVIAMKVVTLVTCRAAEHGLLSPISNATNMEKLSIYADECGVLFVKPTFLDVIR